MKTLTTLAFAVPTCCVLIGHALALSSVEINTAAHSADGFEIVRRLEPANQPNGYTPQFITCPTSAPTVRAASGLSSAEITWLETRRPVALQSMVTLLSRLNISDFDAATYFSTYASNVSALPTVGIAASGGGYRALMNGAGALAAFDDRSPSSTTTGQVGGLLQASTYLAGLSGGSWLVSSIFANNFTSVQDIIDGVTPVWDFSDSVLKGPNQGVQVITSAEYYYDLYDEVHGKSEAGFDITLTDFWGRGLSFQLINADDGGPDYTFSSLQNQTFFTNGSVPMPIILSAGRMPDQTLIPSNATIFEFNPWEMGSWDPTVYGFAPLEYIGTNFSNGAVDAGDSCVVGIDNIGYVFGTSSTLFNQIVLDFNTTVSLPSVFENLIQAALNEFGERNNDISDLNNPFYGYQDATNPWATTRRLTLVDGGENLENLPLHALIQPFRHVDVIFAIDSSADTTTNWPNGTSLVATYERSLNSTIQNNSNFSWLGGAVAALFPSIPDQNTFVNLGLNQRPTFFGCNASNSSSPSSSSSSSPPPLIAYLPNSPYTTLSNVSTYDLSYNDIQRNAIIENGYNVATRGNSSIETWPTCVGCAILRRSWERTGTAFPADCQTCFANYCWDGTTNETTPATYEPTVGLPQAASAATSSVSSSSTSSSSASSSAASSSAASSSAASSSTTPSTTASSSSTASTSVSSSTATISASPGAVVSPGALKILKVLAAFVALFVF